MDEQDREENNELVTSVTKRTKNPESRSHSNRDVTQRTGKAHCQTYLYE